jgi:hypothetical protein
MLHHVFDLPRTAALNRRRSHGLTVPSGFLGCRFDDAGEEVPNEFKTGVV